MTDFKTALISKLEQDVPELRDKIQAGAVDAQTPVPYSAFSTPEEQPIRTHSGIAGYITTFELAIFHSRTSELEQLKHRVIKALDMEIIADKRCNYKSGESAFYPDYNVHGYTLTFRII